MEDCGASAADVEWLSVKPGVAILAPGQSVNLKITVDPNVAQPGTYTASVGIKEDTPGTVESVKVTMVVKPPNTWGKLTGTVTGVSCAGAGAPLPGATVQADSGDSSWTFETATDGTYASWFNSIYSPLQLIAAKDGYQPQTRKAQIKGGKITAATSRSRSVASRTTQLNSTTERRRPVPSSIRDGPAARPVGVETTYGDRRAAD